MAITATLGKTIAGNKEIKIDNLSRTSGLYILGKPGMGKSSLLLNLMLQDVSISYGLFFIDPHGDALQDFIKHADILAMFDTKDAWILDPENNHNSFGINPLYCRDITNLKEREDTYTRAYNIFHKIWEEDWGVWLQLIIQNTLYAFIENPDYTLAEVPLFLINENFRYHLAKNIKYNLDVRDFWLARFEGKKPVDQQRQVDAALTRVSTLLGHPYIKHIIGQQKSTIDFNKILTEGRIVVVKLSAALAEDIKKFIGTILISELLHAVRNRPDDKRNFFGIFIDEFQNFASSDDFATLITEARKFGIATTLAHQERFGQLGDNKKLLGATLAAANQVFFQLTVKDAQELAPEFAEMSSDTAHRSGADLVVSPHAVEDIWEKGHPDKDVMHARNAYFWIVDLLKRQEDYFVFDPSKCIPYFYQKHSQTKLDYQAFNDWDMYRASKDMIREGIELLDKYYYVWMTHKYPPGQPLIDDLLQLILKITECLGGIFGFRPIMEPYIPDDMRRLLLQRMNDYDQREIDKITSGYRPDHYSEKWQQQDVLNFLIKQQIPRYPNRWRLEQIPSRVNIGEINKHYQMALAYGFSTTDLNKFIKWRVIKMSHIEERAYIRLIKYLYEYFIIFSYDLAMKKDKGIPIKDSDEYIREYREIVREYTRVMTYDPLRFKLGEDFTNLPLDTVHPFMMKASERVIWQVNELSDFFNVVLFKSSYLNLAQNPVKIPSSHYEQSPKRDLTQRELIDKMAQELSSLPRFHAFAKLLQERDGQQFVEKYKLATFPLIKHPDELYKHNIYRKLNVCNMTEAFCKPRSEIDGEIAKRQALWKKGLSSPPAEKKEEKQEADMSRRPPPTSFSTLVSGEKENKQQDVESEGWESRRGHPDSISVYKPTSPGQTLTMEPRGYPLAYLLDSDESGKGSSLSSEDTAGKPQEKADVPVQKKPPPKSTTS